MKKFRNWFLLLLAAVTAACLVSGPLDAKKPPHGGGNPPPPLPGTIVFDYDDGLWGMDGDGSNQRPIFAPEFFGAPSSRVYGSDGHRWVLFAAPDGRTVDRVIDETGAVIATDVPHRELMAARFDSDGNLAETRWVCDSFGIANFLTVGGFGGFESNAVQLPSWSNDTQDTFVSWFGRDVRDAFTVESDGTITVDTSKLGRTQSLFKITISGAEIEAGVVAGPQRFTVLSASWETNFHWHPSGQYFIQDSRRDDPETGQAEWDIRMHDGTTGAVLWTRTSNVQWGSMTWRPQEVDPPSHLGLLMFIEDNELKIMPADPTGFDDAVTVFVPDGKNSSMGSPIWSPDGTHIFLQQLSRQGRFGGEYHVTRMTAAGGEQFNLEGSLDAQWLYPMYWLTNDASTAP